MPTAFTFTTHEGDTDPMVVTLRDAQRQPVDLRGATVVLTAWKRGVAVPVLDAVPVTVLEPPEGEPAVRGRVSYGPVPLPRGTYPAEFTATWPDPPGQRTFPNDAPFRIRVTKAAVA